MARIIILGGGFGGVSIALTLRERIGDGHDLVLVDRRPSFFMGLRKLWVMVGLADIEEGTRALARLRGRGIDVRRSEITRIEPAERRVWLDGSPEDADFLVVALGAVPRPDLVPGMAEHAFNLYDVDSVHGLADAVAAFSGGTIAVTIAGLPYRCPPAPYEAAFLLEHHFRERGLGPAVELRFSTMQPALLPNAGPVGAARIAAEFDRRGIDHRTGRKVAGYEAGRVLFEDGEQPFDLGIGVPPHRPPPVIRESGLTGDGEWVRVDPGTLETGFPGVYAIGDVTHIPLAGGAALPKAGLFAEAQGLRVAAAIAARLTGGAEPPPFDGRGFCWMEMGGGEATLVQGDFYAQPAPDVRVADTSAEHERAKHAFEAERLRRWFGE